MTKLVSYFTPRISRLESENKLIMFGLQAFIKTYLVVDKILTLQESKISKKKNLKISNNSISITLQEERNYEQ